MLISIILTILIGGFILIYLYVKLFVYTYWNRKGVWQFSSTFPFGKAGPLFWRQQHICDFFLDAYNEMKSKKITKAGMYLLTKPHLMISDPDDIKTVLASRFDHFRDRGIFSSESVDPLSLSIFSLPAERWKQIRSKLSPFFTPNRMKMIFPIMESCGPSLIEVLRDYVKKNEAINMKDLIYRFTSTVLASCVFGFECNTMKNPNDQIKLVGKDIFEPNMFEATIRKFFFLMPNVLKLLRLPSNSKFVQKFFFDLVSSSIDYRESQGVTRQDLMQMLIDLRIKKDENGISDDGLTLNEIASQCWVFFAGGFETAATAFCLFELAKNIEIQDKLRIEVNEVLAKHDDKFTYDALSEMKYVERVVKETLRMYPPLPFLNRECTKEFTFPDSSVKVHKGDGIVISVLGVQRDPDVYPDPMRFDPDRFDLENGKINPYTFLPFGEGPRNCIGYRMGMIQGKYTIALLLKHFKFTFNNKTKLPIQLAKNTFTLSIDGGMWLNAENV